MTAPALTVVIPTHNRPAALARLLSALSRQDAVPGGFDVVVVADGCSDQTVREIRTTAWPFALMTIEQPASGPAASRNAGAAKASGQILLFLDDDIEPLPGVVRAHATFHAEVANGIGLGDLQPVIAGDDLFALTLRGWLEGMRDRARIPGYRYTFRDLLTGHLSIARSAFEELGGFDASLRCHEDYEFGVRAIEAGMSLRFLHEAVARNHDDADLDKVLCRKFDEGVADVQLSAMYPPLARQLPLTGTRPRSRFGRWLLRQARNSSDAGRLAARAARPLLAAYASARLRFRWRALLEDLLDYAYFSGVAAAGGPPAPSIREASIEPELTLDLAQPIADAESTLDRARPRSVRLLYHVHFIADVRAAAGTERLRGAHLRRLIAHDFALEYLRAASRAGALPPILGAIADELDGPVPARRRGAAHTEAMAS
jgi:glycosyltransferase involved in cell wall biosynthesis